MKISPLDIRKQEFKKAVRGYDVDEVRSFLTMIADEYEGLLNRAKEMKKQMDHLKSKVDEYETSQSDLKDSMYDVHQIQQQKAEKVLEEAEYIKQKAQFEAERMIHEAKKRHHRLLEEIHRLDGLRKGFLVKMHHILGSQLELVQILEEEDPTEELGVSMKKLAQAADRIKANKKVSPVKTVGAPVEQQVEATAPVQQEQAPVAKAEPEAPRRQAAKVAAQRFRTTGSGGVQPQQPTRPATQPAPARPAGTPQNADSGWFQKQKPGATSHGDSGDKDARKTHFDL